VKVNEVITLKHRKEKEETSRRRGKAMEVERGKDRKGKVKRNKQGTCVSLGRGNFPRGYSVGEVGPAPRFYLVNQDKRDFLEG
jgi:hypothetical protein